MASQTIVTYVDDIDGSSADIERYSFSWLGTDYEIDLGPKTSKKLVDVMSIYIEKAEKVSKTRRTARTKVPASQSGSREQLQQVREWARGEGYEVSDRGRVSQSVKDAYDAAH